MRIDTVESQGKERLEGEFLAVDEDSLYVLVGYGPHSEVIRTVARAWVEKARVAHFDPQTGRIAGWTVVGALSTASHGLVAGVTFPLWVITGTALAASHSRTPLENYPNLPWEELRRYARYPQGPPPQIRQLGLHSKRWE
jgi:hypothetical protein